MVQVEPLLRKLPRPSSERGGVNLKDLLEILACPACKTPVHLSDDETAIICDRCRRRYPIRDGIPVMLVEEAEEPAA